MTGADISLERADVSDAEELHAIQLRSFRALFAKYRDADTSPGAEDLPKTVRRLERGDTDMYFIRLGDLRIGAVRVCREGALRRLKQICVLPEFQGNGYAQRAIALAEAMYPEAERWELDTIKQEAKLCHLYEKMGYARTGEERPVKAGMDLVFYAKRR